MHALGVEIEMPVAALQSGASHKVGPYFAALAALKAGRGAAVELQRIGDCVVGLHSGCVVSGLDNAFNNLESAIGPLCGVGNLLQLQAMIRQELEDVSTALDQEPGGGAMVLNFSQHPDVRIDQAYYLDIRCPKGIYDYWVGYRGWSHHVGVDAKAHNGPTTGVEPREAVHCLNVILGAAPCFIALYANSPFEAGRLTGLAENRLTIWPRMFATSRFPGDRFLHRMPARPFRGWGDYFLWMFGPGTAMHFVSPLERVDYKKPGTMLLPEGDPPLLEFLAQRYWPARPLHGGVPVMVQPSLRHLEFQQFGNFLDARVRFGLGDIQFREPFLERLTACQDADADPGHWPGECATPAENAFCELMAGHLLYSYIEGRAAGANQADRELLDLPDTDVAASVASSACAFQLGLCNNLERAHRLLAGVGWETLRGLRGEVVRHGLRAEWKGQRVTKLCATLLDLAAAGLSAAEQRLLAYPRHVLSKGQNGSDRAVAAFERLNGPPEERLHRLIQARRMLVPQFRAF